MTDSVADRDHGDGRGRGLADGLQARRAVDEPARSGPRDLVVIKDHDAHGAQILRAASDTTPAAEPKVTTGGPR